GIIVRAAPLTCSEDELTENMEEPLPPSALDEVAVCNLTHLLLEMCMLPSESERLHHLHSLLHYMEVRSNKLKEHTTVRMDDADDA
ncbi:hypothetical protein, partial [Vibrio cholerae]|uniref:hypothetical protein n=1 Tax=Vibrio cholerae TaxID=666 RepID=UPI0018F060BC